MFYDFLSFLDVVEGAEYLIKRLQPECSTSDQLNDSGCESRSLLDNKIQPTEKSQ